jgi:hypothetical protein
MTFNKQNFPLNAAVRFHSLNEDGDSPLEGATGKILGKSFENVLDHYMVLLDVPTETHLAISITEACLKPVEEISPEDDILAWMAVDEVNVGHRVVWLTKAAVTLIAKSWGHSHTIIPLVDKKLLDNAEKRIKALNISLDDALIEQVANINWRKRYV